MSYADGLSVTSIHIRPFFIQSLIFAYLSVTFDPCREADHSVPSGTGSVVSLPTPRSLIGTIETHKICILYIF